MSKTNLTREQVIEHLDEIYTHLNQLALSGDTGARRAMPKIQQAVGDLDVSRAANLRTMQGFGTGLPGTKNVVDVTQRQAGRFVWKDKTEEEPQKKSEPSDSGKKTASPAGDQSQSDGQGDDDQKAAALDAVRGLTEEQLLEGNSKEELAELASQLGIKVGARASKAVIAKSIVNAIPEDQDQ